MLEWGDLFTARQKTSLSMLASETRAIGNEYPPIAALLALNLGRYADYATSLCSWKNTTEKLNHTYGRQALPIMWDFAEVSFLGDMAGNLDWIIRVVSHESTALARVGQTQCADATVSPLPDASCDYWMTDPPYYDAIPYSDLSDFFFVWLKRALPNTTFLRDPFDSSNSAHAQTGRDRSGRCPARE